MFCEKCGNELQDGQAFCPNCGNHVGVKQTVSQAQPQVQSVSGVDMSQLIDQKRFIRCSHCGQVYAKAHFSATNIILIVLGVACCFFFLPLGALFLVLGCRRKHPPCPTCGNTEKELEAQRLRKQQFSSLTADKNNAFYRFLSTWQEKIKLADICNILLVVLGFCLIFPYFSDITVKYYAFGELMEKKAMTYGDAILNVDDGMSVMCLLMAYGTAILIAVSRKSSLRVRTLMTYVVLAVCIANLVFIFIPTETYLVEGLASKIVGKYDIELVTSGSVDFNGVKFWLIFLQIVVAGLAYLSHEFEKAVWLSDLEKGVIKV